MARNEMTYRLLGAGLALLVATQSACGGPQSTPYPDADQVVEDWVDAVEREDWESAWQLLGPEARPVATLEEFVQWCETHRNSLLDEAAFIEEGRAPARVDARLASTEGLAAQLSYRDGRWLLSDFPLPPMHRLSPEAALEAFLQLALSPNVRLITELSTSSAINSELDAVQRAIQEGESGTLEVRGDSASWTTDSVVIWLAREAQGWTVVTLGWNEYDYYGH